MLFTRKNFLDAEIFIDSHLLKKFIVSNLILKTFVLSLGQVESKEFGNRSYWELAEKQYAHGSIPGIPKVRDFILMQRSLSIFGIGS